MVAAAQDFTGGHVYNWVEECRLICMCVYGYVTTLGALQHQCSSSSPSNVGCIGLYTAAALCCTTVELCMGRQLSNTGSCSRVGTDTRMLREAVWLSCFMSFTAGARSQQQAQWFVSCVQPHGRVISRCCVTSVATASYMYASRAQLSSASTA
jgi:hypothetical protein